MADETSSHRAMFDETPIRGAPYEKGRWRAIAVHDETRIHGFFGPYRFLSNMWRAEVTFEGTLFPAVENAYQAAKFDRSEWARFAALDPLESKRVSRDMPMIWTEEEWLLRRVPVMRACVISKFTAPALRTMLRGTRPRHLAEKNWWGDRFWGCDENDVGENRLGELLMEIRYID